MPSMNCYERLEEIAKWWDWHKDTVSDVVKRQQFQEKMIENMLDEFALIINELRAIKSIYEKPLERPSWLPNSISTFHAKKPPNPDDPELGLRG